MECQEAKEFVVKAGIELVKSELIARTWGNVSCRIDGETFVITPSGREYLSLTPDEIVEVKIKDLSYEGTIKPSSEKGIHAEVYRLFPDVNFVIHTHQENASALSAVGLDAIPLTINTSVFSKEILCAKYALPGTKTLRKNVLEALKKTKSKAIILKHHGALCFGEDYEKTLKTAHELEEICKNFVADKKGNQRITKEEQKHDRTLTNSQLFVKKEAVLNRRGGFMIYNTDPEVIRYSKLIKSKPLKPFLDDFAQIVGIRAKVVENKTKSVSKALQHSSAVFIKGFGALCWGKDEKDATAVSMILRKNCKTYFTAKLFGKPTPLNILECALMRFVYLKKYSKMSEKPY